MRRLIIPFSIALCCGIPIALNAAENSAPQLQLAKIYQQDIKLRDYWVSEKLDGVRAFWNGKKLITRQGHVIHAPAWFTASLPNTQLDGELWFERDQFSTLSGIVRKQAPVDSEWRQVKYMLFDMPADLNVFDRRVQSLKEITRRINLNFIQMIEQVHVESEDELNTMLQRVVSQGGEGLMLHRGGSLYQAVRNDDLMKLKTYQDAEARAVAYLPGKGQFSGMLGALLVELPDGRQFKIGTGFTLEERKNPPPIGALITYRFRGRTHNDLPRFASFMRVRDDY